MLFVLLKPNNSNWTWMNRVDRKSLTQWNGKPFVVMVQVKSRFTDDFNSFIIWSYASRINRRVSRAFSFSQDTPNKIKKTISSVFRSPFQSGYLHTSHSLHEQKSSKLSSLASLQLTPTLLETRPFQQKTIYQQITKSARNIHILNDAITKHTSKGAFLTPYRNKNRKDENLDDVDDNEDDFENRNSNENEISNKLIFKNKNDFDSLSYDSGLNSCTKAVSNQLTKIKRTFNTIHNIENNQSITSLDSIDTS